MAAAIGGGVTAAALLGAGAVDGGDDGGDDRVAAGGEARAGAAARPRAAGSARARSTGATRPGVVFIRAQTLRTDPTPFDVYGPTAADARRPAPASCSTRTG